MQELRQWDVSLFRAINVDLHRSWLDPYFMVLSYSGLGISIAIFCVLLLCWKPTQGLALPLGLSTALGGFVFADGLKAVIARDRPSNLAWSIVQEDYHFHSFPSGHSAASFGFAAMLFFLLYRSDYRWIGWCALVWSSSVALSRIYRGVHWPTDTAAGALCGFLAASLIYSIYARGGWLPNLDAAATDEEESRSSVSGSI